MRIGRFQIGFAKSPSESRQAGHSGSGVGDVRQPWQSPYLAAIRDIQTGQNYKLMKLLRDSIPCIDTAVDNIARLCGTVEVAADEPLKTDIERFLRDLRVNYNQTSYVTAMQEQVRNELVFGPAVMEMVPNNAGDDIYAVLNADSDTIVFQQDPADPMKVVVAQRQNGAASPVPLREEWLLVNVYGGGSNPYGRSLLASLPFVAEIMLSMEEALKLNWERFGVPNFHVNWVPPDEFNDPQGMKSAAIMAGVEKNFVAAMKARKSGEVRDFFSSGKVTVNTIGADGQPLEFVTSGRSIMEQIVGRTHLPAWMLGFTWSSTERMSKQQADMVISFIDSIQTGLTASNRRLVQLWMDLTGRTGEFELTYKSVTLQDALDSARAEFTAAQGDKTREEVGTRLWRNGIFNQEKYAEYVLGEDWDGTVEEEMDEPSGGAPVEAPVPPNQQQNEQQVPPEGETGDVQQMRQSWTY